MIKAKWKDEGKYKAEDYSVKFLYFKKYPSKRDGDKRGAKHREPKDLPNEVCWLFTHFEVDSSETNNYGNFGYLLKSGLRFSTNEFFPSLASSLR